MELTVTEIDAGPATVVSVAGVVDLSTSRHLAARLLELIESGGRTVVVDLDQVTFLDSTGLTALVAASRAATDRAAELRLARPTPNVVELLTITGLTRLIPTHASVEEAVEGVGRPG